MRSRRVSDGTTAQTRTHEGAAPRRVVPPKVLLNHAPCPSRAIIKVQLREIPSPPERCPVRSDRPRVARQPRGSRPQMDPACGHADRRPQIVRLPGSARSPAGGTGPGGCGGAPRGCVRPAQPVQADHRPAWAGTPEADSPIHTRTDRNQPRPAPRPPARPHRFWRSDSGLGSRAPSRSRSIRTIRHASPSSRQVSSAVAGARPPKVNSARTPSVSTMSPSSTTR